jgi:hypothetical protein
MKLFRQPTQNQSVPPGGGFLETLDNGDIFYRLAQPKHVAIYAVEQELR